MSGSCLQYEEDTSWLPNTQYRWDLWFCPPAVQKGPTFVRMFNSMLNICWEVDGGCQSSFGGKYMEAYLYVWAVARIKSLARFKFMEHWVCQRLSSILIRGNQSIRGAVFEGNQMGFVHFQQVSLIDQFDLYAIILHESNSDVAIMTHVVSTQNITLH